MYSISIEGERHDRLSTALPTANQEWGFWGTSVRNGYDAELTWDATSRFLAKEFHLTAEQARDVLDARFGRHLADDLSFIDNGTGNAKGPISAAAIAKHLTARVADQGWRDSFENAIRETTGITFPRKAPMTKEALFTQIAATASWYRNAGHPQIRRPRLPRRCSLERQGCA
jgi:hypothetical protein